MEKSTINEIKFEVWYVSPVDKERRLGAFHYRYDAEAYMAYLSKTHKGKVYIKEA